MFPMSHSDRLDVLGENLRAARKQVFPNDNLQAFALRIGVGRATLQRMEKGDLAVSIGKYYRAAAVLGLAEPFLNLLQPRKSLFDD
jgi:transcriptional regulator with XRE-family HTH domain|tara:strand:+ start:1749 stop:2006 length:258 start_codon:yes stop_codon:yes gene_type:complete